MSGTQDEMSGTQDEENTRIAVQFLQNPRVRDFSVQDQVKFLREKGLTEDVVQNALKQCNLVNEPEEVVAEQLVAEEVVAEVVEPKEVVAEEVVAEEVVPEEVLAEEVVAEEVVVEEVVAEEVVAEEVVAEEVVAEKVVAEEVVLEEVVPEEVVAEVVDEPVSTQPAVLLELSETEIQTENKPPAADASLDEPKAEAEVDAIAGPTDEVVSAWTWWRVGKIIVVGGIALRLVNNAYKNHIRPFLRSELKEDERIQDLVESVSFLKEETKRNVSELSGTLKQLQDLIGRQEVVLTSINNNLSAIIQSGGNSSSDTEAVKEIKHELTSLKTLLLSRNQFAQSPFSPTVSKPAIPAWQHAQNEQKERREREQREQLEAVSKEADKKADKEADKKADKEANKEQAAEIQIDDEQDNTQEELTETASKENSELEVASKENLAEKEQQVEIQVDDEQDNRQKELIEDIDDEQDFTQNELIEDTVPEQLEVASKENNLASKEQQAEIQIELIEDIVPDQIVVN